MALLNIARSSQEVLLLLDQLYRQLDGLITGRLPLVVSLAADPFLTISNTFPIRTLYIRFTASQRSLSRESRSQVASILEHALSRLRGENLATLLTLVPLTTESNDLSGAPKLLECFGTH